MTQKTIFDLSQGRDWLKNLLRTTDVSVTFTKKDGSDRTMVCTLDEDKIPVDKAPKSTGKVENPDVQPVFDVEKNEWRSFRWNSVKYIEA